MWWRWGNIWGEWQTKLVMRDNQNNELIWQSVHACGCVCGLLQFTTKLENGSCFNKVWWLWLLKLVVPVTSRVHYISIEKQNLTELICWLYAWSWQSISAYILFLKLLLRKCLSSRVCSIKFPFVLWAVNEVCVDTFKWKVCNPYWLNRCYIACGADYEKRNFWLVLSCINANTLYKHVAVYTAG